MLILNLLLVPTAIYVSDRGNDAATGTASHPFRTVARALQELPTVHRSSPAVEIVLRGTFRLAAPLTIGPEASDTRLKSWDPNHPATITGGAELRDWQRVDADGKTIWACDVPKAPHYRQLWLGGTRPVPIAAIRNLKIAGLLNGAEKEAWNVGEDAAKFTPADLPPIAHPEDVEFVGIHRWAESRMGVKDIDRTNSILHFDRKSVFQLTDSEGFSPYRIENVAEELGKSGNWCYDRVNSRILFASPRNPGLCVVSSCPTLLVVNAAKNFKVDNIAFCHTGWEPTADSAGDGQAATSVPAALTLNNCQNCEIEGSRFEHLGTYAVEIAGQSADNTVERCQMSDLGGGGVKINHGTTRSIVQDCRMLHIGRIFASAIGAWIGDSGHNIVAHNEVRDLYYTGISLGWTWGYGPSHAVANRIEFNDISDVGQGELSDMGGIYSLGVSPGTVERGNRIQRVESRTYGAWGIYLDEGSSHILVTDNFVRDTKTGGFHQHYGQDNLIQNNVFINARTAGQVIRTRQEDHRSFTFEKNVVVWKGTDLLGSNWQGAGFDIDQNVYWRTDDKPVTFAGQSLEEWRSLGHDKQSIIADPEMTITNDGVSFAPDSPAQKLGIHPIDMSSVGPR